MDDATEAKHLFEPTGDFQCLHDFIPAARASRSDHIWGYLVGATESETTLRRNRPRSTRSRCGRACARCVKIDTGTTLFGRKLRLPVMLAPVGSLESFDAGGAATAGRGRRGVRRADHVSARSRSPGWRRPRRRRGPKIFQLYVRGDEAWVDDVVKRAVDHGYRRVLRSPSIPRTTPARARHRRPLRQAVARGGDRARVPGRVHLGQRQALQGQASAFR